jgi:hypothetical protein
MDVCSLSIEEKKSTRSCCFIAADAPGADTDSCRVPVRELNGFVGSGRAKVSQSWVRGR